MLTLRGDPRCSSLTLSLQPAIPSEIDLLYPKSLKKKSHWTVASYVSIPDESLELEGQKMPTGQAWVMCAALGVRESVSPILRSEGAEVFVSQRKIRGLRAKEGLLGQHE